MPKKLICTVPLAVLLVLGGLAQGVVGQDEAPPPGFDVAIEERSVTTRAGAVIPYEVGTLTVPENRGAPASRRIGVGFARIRSTSGDPSVPPIFLLPGGPGGSYVDAFDNDNERQRARQIERYARFRDVADLVVVDQRGFSRRGDRFWYEQPLAGRLEDRAWSEDDEVAALRAAAEATVAEHAARGVDLRGYTVVECAHDVADLATALGYPRITLKGTSFGSQWSLAVMRLHPERVARALLSGVEPLDHGYDMPRHVFAAVQRMWRAVDRDRRYAPFLPEGGMAVVARRVIERLEKEAVPVHRADDPERILLWLGPQQFPWHDPAAIVELDQGVLTRWQVQTLLRERQGVTRARPLIGPLIDSSLGVSAARWAELAHDPAARYLGRSFAAYVRTADVWPTEDVGDAVRLPVRCEIPVVFAQGDWDLKTPVENTFEIAPWFPNSHVLVAERGGHGVFGPIEREHPEVWQRMVEFLRTGTLDGIPHRVRLAPSMRFARPNCPVPDEVAPGTRR